LTTVAIVDTNADPHIIDYPIPANDDAVGSIELISTYIMDAWIEGRKIFEANVQKQAAKEAAQAAKKEEKPKVEAPASLPKPEVKAKKAPKKVKKETKAKTEVNFL
jgi:small subunit ribosomal protein S2